MLHSSIRDCAGRRRSLYLSGWRLSVLLAIVLVLVAIAGFAQFWKPALLRLQRALGHWCYMRQQWRVAARMPGDMTHQTHALNAAEAELEAAHDAVARLVVSDLAEVWRANRG